MKIKRIFNHSIILCVIVILLLTLVPYNVLATGVINPDDFEPEIETGKANGGIIAQKASGLVMVISVIGIIVMVTTLLVLGIKYMTGTITEKAEYKKSMIPYLIGAFIFFAISQILAVIIQMVDSINT